MLAPRTILGLLLAGVAIMGCKKGPTAPEPPTPVATQPPPAPAVAAPAPPTGSTSSAPLPIAPAPLPENPTSLPALPAGPGTLTTTTPASGGDSATNAKAVLTDAEQNVAAKKWDAARDDFKKLNAMKGQLSPDLKAQVDQAEAKFVAAKAGSALKLPGLGLPTTSETPAEPNK